MNINEEIVGWIEDQCVPWSSLIMESTLPPSPTLKLALLSMLAGYRFSGRMRVEFPPTDISAYHVAVAPFLSFLLKYPENITMPEVTIQWGNKNRSTISQQPRSGRIVLASGGIDSTAALLYFKAKGMQITALWIHYGQPYAEQEWRAVQFICTTLKIPLKKVRVMMDDEIVKGTPIFKHIVPGRNFMLCAVAATLGAETITLASLYDERKVPDKSPRFFNSASALLKSRISSPFHNLMKTDVLALWKRHWSNLILPHHTITCYDHSGRCGRCNACLKRAIAFAAAGWEPEATLQVDPLADECMLISGSLLTRWDTLPSCRQIDTLLAFDNARDRISQTVWSFASEHLRLRKTEVEDRRKTLKTASLKICEEF